jgi:hypothetical protein
MAGEGDVGESDTHALDAVHIVDTLQWQILCLKCLGNCHPLMVIKCYDAKLEVPLMISLGNPDYHMDFLHILLACVLPLSMSLT